MTPINANNKTRTKKRLAVAAGASALVLALALGACSTDDPSPRGSGEAGESHGGSEGAGLGEAAESGGTATVLNIGDTFDEVQSGARLILSFDTNTNSFVGSVENTTSAQLTRARIEVHLDNGTELGPTTPVDLNPGEVLPLDLPSTQASFQTWTAHPEVGSGEGGSEGSGEGLEGGNEGGSASTAPTTYLTTSGTSRGVLSGPELQADDYYADNLDDLEFALAYDDTTRSFQGSGEERSQHRTLRLEDQSDLRRQSGQLSERRDPLARREPTSDVHDHVRHCLVHDVVGPDRDLQLQ